MLHVATADSVTLTFSSSECRSITRLAERRYGDDPTISKLIHRLHDAASLAQWLRSEIRLDVSIVDAALLRELRRSLYRLCVNDTPDAEAMQIA